MSLDSNKEKNKAKSIKLEVKKFDKMELETYTASKRSEIRQHKLFHQQLEEDTNSLNQRGLSKTKKF